MKDKLQRKDGKAKNYIGQFSLKIITRLQNMQSHETLIGVTKQQYAVVQKYLY